MRGRFPKIDKPVLSCEPHSLWESSKRPPPNGSEPGFNRRSSPNHWDSTSQALADIGRSLPETMSLREILRPKNASDFTAGLIAGGEVHTAIDIGCGCNSHLSQFRPTILTIGVDSDLVSIRLSKERGLHDHYVQANILTEDIGSLLEKVGLPRKADLVGLYGVIEHLPRHLGFELLRACEAITNKYVILETPHGFVPQGPEYGNPHQRHLSGWYIQDFEALGYTVHGTTGTRYFRGYMAEPTLSFPGGTICEELATLLLRINSSPQHAFNLLAIKDVRGVPARHAGAPVIL